MAVVAALGDCARVDSLTAVPSSLIAGDSVSIRRTFATVSVGDGYTVTLRLAPVTGPGVSITATEDTSAFVFAVGSTHTKDLAIGTVSWSFIATKDPDRYTLEQGVLSLLPDPESDSASANSQLGHIERVIAACQAKLEGKLTDDVQMYQLPGGLTVSKMTLREVRETLSMYLIMRRRALNGGRLTVRRLGYAIR